jgi:Flp pilus assembly protein TadD/O-antigen ligase
MKATRFEDYRFYIIITLLFLTPLFYVEPQIFGVSLADSFTFPKRYLTEFCALILLLLFAGEFVAKKEIRLCWSRCLLPYGLIIAWSCLSLIYSPSLHTGWREIVRWLCYGIIYISVLNTGLTERRRALLLTSVMIPVTVTSLLALAQFFDLDPSYFKGERHIVYSTFGNPNFLASYLAVTLPIGYWGWITKRRKERRFVTSFLFSLMGTAALIVTGSRGGIAGLSVAFLCVLLLFSRAVNAKRLIALIAGIAILATSSQLFAPAGRRGTLVRDKFSEMTGSPPAGIAWRWMVWNVCGEMIADGSVMGSGSGSFNMLYPFYLEKFLKGPGNRHYIPLAEGAIDYAHNEYLQILVELGLTGFAFFIWFIVSLITMEYDAAKRTEGTDWMNIALLTGCVALLLHCLVSFPFHMWAPAVTFFIFSGMATRGYCKEKVVRLESSIVMGILTVLILVITLYASIRITSTIVSEMYYSQGLRSFYGNQRSEALRQFSEAVRWQPHNGRAHLFLGLSLIEEGKRHEAARELLSSLKTYNHQVIHTQLGRVYREIGNMKEAESFLEHAVAMSPRDPDAWLEQGNLLFSEGDLEGAASCFLKACELRPGYFQALRNLAVSYDALGREDAALAAYKRAVTLEPGAAELYVNMGVIWARRGDTRKARELWQEALSHDPSNKYAKSNLDRLADTEKKATGQGPDGK